MNRTSLSIIVCTYNRSDILPHCLESLAGQTAPPGSFEVIVVDNNSTDNTHEAVSSFIKDRPNFRLVSETAQGLSHARNRGWKEARADWIAYIDDDAKAATDYVERALHVIGTHPFDCFGGIYLPWYHYGKPRWFRDSYAVVSNEFVQDHTGPIAEGFYASGGNLVIRRSVLEELGGFSSRFGMRAGTLAYGEETELQLRMQAAGMSIGFDPGLSVLHLVNRYKTSTLWLLRFQYASRRDAALVSGTVPTWRHFADIFRNAARHTARTLAACPRMLKRDDYYLQNLLMDVFQPLAGYLGRLSGTLAAYARHKGPGKR